ncbi:MAG: CDP-alcohol phosphatidyltransferase family protein [Patescibacteria group bacterium]
MQDSRQLKLLAVNALTVMGMISALIAIMLIIRGAFALSLAVAVVGFVCDSLDGPLARRLSVVTRFGAGFDALVDLMLYLVYPAVSWYIFFAFHDVLALLVLLFFLLCGSFRLVRTATKGVQLGQTRHYFVGVPVVLSLPLLIGSFAITLIEPGWNSTYLYATLPLFS